ncbi:MAG: PAS domain-containing protein, partial [Reinekea sp.]|nr:PAS domain-containing protein [Reinekea sp.]
MKAPDIPANETDRIEKLRSLDILDTPPEAIFDDLTRLAAIACGTPFSVVSLIDDDRQWFKSIQGELGIQETSREISFCGHTIFEEQLFIVEDTLQDERFKDNPVVTESPNIRFYAGAPLTTSDGLTLGTLCVFGPEPSNLTDDQKVSLQLLAKQATEKIECRLTDTLLESVSDVLDISETYVFMFDPRTEHVTDSNPKLLTQLPDPQTKNVRKLLASLFPDLDYDTLIGKTSADELPATPIKTRLTFPGQTDGSAQIRVLPRYTGGRNTIVVLFRDDTELAKTRTSAQDAQFNFRLFNQVALQTSASVVICDATGHIEWVNHSFEKLTGYSLEECYNKKPGEFLQGADTNPETKAKMSELLKESEPVSVEILNYTKSGQAYWVDILIEPIHDDTGRLTHFVSTQTDITERKAHEIALESARKAAEHANAAKSQFLAKISHELRTPLNGILGVTENLLDQAPENLQDMVGTLHQSANHLFSLLNDLLELTQLQHGHFTLRAESVCLAELLSDVEHLFATRANSVNTSLACTFSKDLPDWVEVDRTR